MFAMPGFERIAPSEDIAERGQVMVGRFANGELHAQLDREVRGRRCLLVGSVTPPDSRLVELLLSADTLARQGAAAVEAILPYLAYARQDRLKPRGSLSAAWIGSQLRAAGVGRVVTVDIHSEEARALLAVPAQSLSPAALLAESLGSGAADDAVVVAPDRGALERSTALAEALGVSAPVAWLEKERDAQGVRHVGLRGELRPRAIVVDDILDTGGTLVSCCVALVRHGVREITVAVTHGLFTGDAWRELFDHGVGVLHTTDSVPEAVEHVSERIKVHTVRPLLEAAPAKETRK